MSRVFAVVVALLLCTMATGILISPVLRRIKSAKTTFHHTSRAAMLPSFNIAEGLDAETLQALSDVSDISDVFADAAASQQPNVVAGELSCLCIFYIN